MCLPPSDTSVLMERGFLNGQIHFVVCSADRTEEVILTEFSSDLWILIHRFTFTRESSGWS